MNLTFEVMLPPRGTTDWAVSCNPTYRVLAPVAIYARKTPLVVGMPCTGYIHCADVPEHPTWPVEWTIEKKVRFMNSVLAGAWSEVVLDNPEIVEKRQWSGDTTGLSNPQRNALLQDRQVEVPWNTLRNLMRDRKNDAGLTADHFIWPPA